MTYQEWLEKKNKLGSIKKLNNNCIDIHGNIIEIGDKIRSTSALRNEIIESQVIEIQGRLLIAYYDKYNWRSSGLLWEKINNL